MSKKHKFGLKLNKNINKNKKKFKNKTKNKGGLSIITDGITPRNEEFERLCLMTQPQLKSFLKERFSDKECVSSDGFLFVKGTVPILLVAHMDTVHKKLPTEMIYANGTLSSPMGIGADDRCGVYMILEIVKYHDCSILFCEDEEIGCVGSEKFCKTKLAKELCGEFNYLIEIDRMNGKDAVFYECDNPEFEEFITKEYWETGIGSYTDICELSPVLEAASVNFSCGYYKQHTKDEYLVLDEMETNIKEICKLIDRTDMEKDKYEFIERSYLKHLYFKENPVIESSSNGDTFYIIFYNKDMYEEMQKVIANSYEEAVGYFLIEHSDMAFEDILDIVTEKEYYEYYILGGQ